MRTPPDSVYERLLILGNGAIALTASKREWLPILRRGWVEVAWASKETKGLMPPLRITPAGLRALADWLERVGPLPIPKREEAV